MSIYANSLIMFFALIISIPRFKSINYHQIRPKIGYLKKKQNFRVLGAKPLDPNPPEAEGFAPKPLMACGE